MTLQAHDITCIRQRNLFTDLSFVLKPGELIWVQSANGAGKSSLLRLLAGLTRPWSGRITWRDQDIGILQHDYWQHVQYIGHANGLNLNLTVAENIALSCHLSLSTNDQRQTKLRELKLHPFLDKTAYRLSAGQKRRVALAKLSLIPKTLWLLDEPFTCLDDETENYFSYLVKNHLAGGGMVVMSAHSLNINAHQTLRIAAC